VGTTLLKERLFYILYFKLSLFKIAIDVLEGSVARTANGTPLTTEKFQVAPKEPIDEAVAAYIITVKSKPGKLLMEKCVKLGVPAGPLLGELKAGRNVVLKDGTVVNAADVVDASTETPQVNDK
jgi:hypothetical protein